MMLIIIYVLFFFFQAEDGIRDLTVTGVQTCALPICRYLHNGLFMATTVATAGRAVVGESNWLKALTNWIRNHKQAAAYLAVALVVALGLFAWNLLSAKTAERSAGRQIAQGRLALDSKNYPLAASVLSQVVENFSGTHGAQEASILLAQARLAQGQTQQAIEVLQRSAPKADKYFRAQTYGLLGAADENALR